MGTPRGVDVIINFQIQWQETGSIERMAKHLHPYSVDAKEALREIFGGPNQNQIRNTQITVKCGTSPEQSYFAFVKGAGNTSLISGYCPSGRMDHLLEDFDYLIGRMHSSKENCKVHKIYIRVNDEKLVKKSAAEYVYKRAVLVDLLTMTGLIPLISTWLLFNEIRSSLIYPVAVGLVLWIATLLVGYQGEPEYVLKK